MWKRQCYITYTGKFVTDEHILTFTVRWPWVKGILSETSVIHTVWFSFLFFFSPLFVLDSGYFEIPLNRPWKVWLNRWPPSPIWEPHSHALLCWYGILLCCFSLLTLQEPSLCVCVWREESQASYHSARAGIKWFSWDWREQEHSRLSAFWTQLWSACPHCPTQWPCCPTPAFTLAPASIQPHEKSLQRAKLVGDGWLVGCLGCASGLSRVWGAQIGVRAASRAGKAGEIAADSK